MPKKLNQTILLTALACLMLALLSACSPYGYSDVAVGYPPPGLRGEVRVLPPGPGYEWVPGYFDGVGPEWVWVSGAWQIPPNHLARWVPPRYTQRHGQWVYRRGYWH